MKKILLSLVSTAVLLHGVPAFASDGVLEINQACATGPGCFVGDTGGFPVQVTSSAGARSFRLTSDLVTSSSTVDVISVSTGDVVIDLNGFAIRGPGTCSGSPNVCTLTSGSSEGVAVTSTSLEGITVRNGSVVGMANSGLSLGDSARVVDVNARENRVTGIVVRNGSFVKDSQVARNGGLGISGIVGTLVENVVAFRNTSTGISVNTGSVVQNSTSYDNGSNGISTSLGCTVRNNSVRGNDNLGLLLGESTGYGGNTITTLSGSAGTVSGGFETAGNVCDGSLTCP